LVSLSEIRSPSGGIRGVARVRKYDKPATESFAAESDDGLLAPDRPMFKCLIDSP
jgi:hypothetical protein